MSNSGILTKINSQSINNPDAILLSNQDVANLRLKKIENYNNKVEIWSLAYGLQSIGLTNMLTNTKIMLMYRKKFLLTSTRKGLLSSLLLTSVFPTAASVSLLGIYHSNVLFNPSLNECMICHELKSVGMHLTFGSIIPTAIAWSINYYEAALLKTYAIPNTDWLFDAKKRHRFIYEFKHVFFKTNKNAFNTLFNCYSIQLVLTSMILYFQQVQYKDKIEPLKFTLSEINSIKN